MNEITVFIRDGRIVIDFSNGALRIDAINLAAKIKRLPDVASAMISKDGTITVSLSSVRDVPALQRRIYAIVNERIPEAPVTTTDQQLSLF